MNNVLVVIPARGGSKGVKNKNVQVLGEYPLLVHSVIVALDAGVPASNVVVSSDDDEILSIAEEWEVVAHRRPDKLCEPLCPTEMALIDAWEAHRDCDTVVTLQPTSPIRAPGLVAACIQAYRNGDHDSLLTTSKFYDFFWRERQEEDRWEWHSTYDPQNRPMRQELTREQFLYFDNGNVYISDAEMLLETKCRCGKKICVYPISQLEGMQVDDETDLDVLRILYEGLQDGNRSLPMTYGESDNDTSKSSSGDRMRTSG
jgi:N-acylneuraminate cytidylyltransferase